MKINDKLEFKSVIYGCLDGADSLAVGSLVETHDKLVYLARDDKRLADGPRSCLFLSGGGADYSACMGLSSL